MISGAGMGVDTTWKLGEPGEIFSGWAVLHGLSQATISRMQPDSA